MTKNILIGTIFIASLIACNKEKVNEPKDTKTYFSGITKTSAMGELLSNPDTTDWRFDDNWTTKEEDLFIIKNSPLNQKCSTQIFIYPNPFQDIFRINLNNLPTSSRLAIRLVDKDFKVILENDSLHGSVTLRPKIIIGLDTLSISGRDTLRLYYKLIDSLNRELKGHGDILIQK